MGNNFAAYELSPEYTARRNTVLCCLMVPAHLGGAGMDLSACHNVINGAVERAAAAHYPRAFSRHVLTFDGNENQSGLALSRCL